MSHLLPPRAAAAHLGVTPVTLARWRYTGLGPAYIRISHPCVRYRVEDLHGWRARREEAKRQRIEPARARAKAYKAWAAAKRRCFNPQSRQFHRYGGRGITMCRQWRENFEAFLYDMGPCPPGLTLDRIDNDGHYEPGNCRWTTWAVNRANRNGSRHAQSDAAPD